MGPSDVFAGRRSWGSLEGYLATATSRELLEATAYGQPLLPEASDLPDKLGQYQAYGATLASLQTGIGVSIKARDHKLYPWIRDLPFPKKSGKRRGRPPKDTLSFDAQRAYDLMKQGHGVEKLPGLMDMPRSKVRRLYGQILKLHDVQETNQSVRAKQSFDDERDSHDARPR